MVEAAGPIQFGPARTENEQIRAPATAVGLVEQGLRVVRSRGALESVQNEKTRRAAAGGQSMDVEKVAVRRIPTLDCRRRRSLSAEKLTPKGLKVRARYPPRR